jgi:hypothetical protein
VSGDFGKLEASRKKRAAKASNGPRNWYVAKVNDDRRRPVVVVTRKLTEEQASDLAGRMRDLMEDRDVGDGWNFLPRRSRLSPGTRPATLKVEPVVRRSEALSARRGYRREPR